jgi:hypothetical protein
MREGWCYGEARNVLFRIVIQMIDVTAAEGNFKRARTRPRRQCARRPWRSLKEIVFGSATSSTQSQAGGASML